MATINNILAAFEKTSEMPTGNDRNKIRDIYFNELCDYGMNSGNMGNSMTNDVLQISQGNVYDFLNHESKYIAYKAKKIQSLIVNEESVLGCLIGCAVGDSVGLVVEGYSRTICHQYVDEIVSKTAISVYHRNNWTFGQYSDDTQLTREMFISITQNKGKMDPMIYALRIARLFQPNAYRIVGYGSQTARAANAIINGAHYTESDNSTGCGNGGAMRSACIGAILVGHSVEEISEVAKVMSSITHSSVACVDAAISIALATNYVTITRDQKLDNKKMIDYICSSKMITDEFKKYLNELVILAEKDFEIASARIIKIGLSHKEKKWGDGISYGVRQTTLWSLWSFMKSPDSFVDCISNSIKIGGDVDSSSAIACAIIGSRIGVSKIPTIWKQQLHDINDWKYEELCDLGKKTCEIMKTTGIHYSP
jgi:ADP-ribosylglycohydrolase